MFGFFMKRKPCVLIHTVYAISLYEELAYYKSRKIVVSQVFNFNFLFIYIHVSSLSHSYLSNFNSFLRSNQLLNSRD